MTRGQMRTMLRRRLQEDQGYEEQWTDSILNDDLNYGLQFMEAEVLKYMPEAFTQIDKTDLYEADAGLLPMPVGAMTILTCWYYDTTNGLYVKCEKRSNDWIDTYESDIGMTSEDAQTYVWAPFGRWIRYWPQVSETVSDGFQVKYVPTLTMSADSDVPDLPLNLHEGVVYRAQEIALGDTDETTSQEVLDALNKRLSVVVSRIPLYLQSDHGDPSQISVDIDVEEGWT